MGRADQSAKVKGLFVHPSQIVETARRHAELGTVRLVVTRAGEQDAMTLHAETASASDALAGAVAATLQALTRLRGEVLLVAPGSLPNDGKIIADERAGAVRVGARRAAKRQRSFRRAAPLQRKGGPMAKFSLDRKRPPELAAGQAARLDAMSEDDIAAAARSDPDNPPLTAEELKRIRAARRVRRVRVRSGLRQTEFARAFHINVARLRDLEQGRTQADSALLAYLTVIDAAPDTVRQALRSAG